MRALVLTGSMARDEATFVPKGIGWRVLGDADFLLVLRSHSTKASQANLQRVINRGLVSAGIISEVTVSHATVAALERMKPRIFSYELRTMGRVVWGDLNILATIPEFSAAAIPRADAWEMLCNRMVEYLEAAAEETDGHQYSELAQYRITKLLLDSATSFLVFAGNYAPSYRGRAEKICALANSMPPQDAPIPLGQFARMVAECTFLKVGPSDGSGCPHTVTREVTIDWARRLWVWEVASLTGLSAGTNRKELLRKLARSQPMQQRCLAWLQLLRRRTVGDWRSWPAWLYHSTIMSPRLLIYSVAADLLFTDRNDPCIATGLFADLQRLLPINMERHCPRTWAQVARDLSHNYREILVG